MPWPPWGYLYSHAHVDMYAHMYIKNNKNKSQKVKLKRLEDTKGIQEPQMYITERKRPL